MELLQIWKLSLFVAKILYFSKMFSQDIIKRFQFVQNMGSIGHVKLLMILKYIKLHSNPAHKTNWTKISLHLCELKWSKP